jgi:hypothetical protein
MMRLILLSILVLGARPANAAEVRAGAAAVRITPPAGAPMAGYYYVRANEGVHDDLYAKALVFESGGARAALVACDLISMPREVAEKARALIERETGIPGAAVMLSATHAHTGPVLVDRSTREDAAVYSLAREYTASLHTRLAEAVKLANERLAPARLSAAIGREESLAFNRRFFMSDGTVGWNPGKLNPKIVRPAGPIDPEVPVVYVEAAQPVAAYVNYALHLDTVGGLQYSADFPYTLSTALSKVKGPDLLTMFTIGTAGNVNHLDVAWRDPQKGHGEAARIGTVLAAAVLKAFRNLKPTADGTLRARSEIVKLPLAEVRAEELGKAREIAARYGKPNAAPFLEMVHAFKVIDVIAREGRPIEAEVQVIALGDVAWVGLPGEIFVELGMAIKKASPFPHTIVAELANGSIGYVPDQRAWPQGNYEVVSARCAPGSGEMLVEAAVRLLKALR